MAISNSILTGLSTSITLDEEAVNLGPQLIDTDVTFIDAENNFDGGTLALSELRAEEIVSIRNQGFGVGLIGFNGTLVIYDGIAIGTATGGTNGADFVVTFNANATATAIEALIENLTYENLSDTLTGERTHIITITDDQGDTAASLPAFNNITGSANPLNGVFAGDYDSPRFVDLDGDGDEDLVIGESVGILAYYENTGTATAPAFTQLTGGANPFDGIDVSNFGAPGYSAPSFVDIDGDGDMDLVIGENGGNLNYYENTGTAIAPVFTVRIGAANPFDGIDVGNASSPVFADLDGDGDEDLIIGESDGNINYFENTGNASVAAFTQRTGVDNPFDAIDVGFRSTPAFVDIDGDGDNDLVIGDSFGALLYYENTGTTLAPVFSQRTGIANPFDGIDIGDASNPTFVDIDNDGDVDMVVGEVLGNLNFYENTGPTLNFIHRAGTFSPFEGIDIGSGSNPVFVDMDGDGDDDLVIGEATGNLNYFENTGTAFAPVFTERAGVLNPLDGIDVGNNSSQDFADIDGDGDQDLIIGEADGVFNYFENTGTALAPVFTQRTGVLNPFDGFDVGTDSTPAFVDIDGDGDSDLVSGNYLGTLNYYENTGSAVAPVYTLQIGAANPFDGIAAGTASNPVFVDMDGDGDQDMVLGGEFSTLLYFENTGSASTPEFIERTGDANPFEGINTGDRIAPQFIDIDGDGDSDLIVGRTDGTLHYYENTGFGFSLSLNITPHTDPSANADVMNGTAATDTISGLGGDDTIRGWGATDYLYGNAGADSLDGGAGDDYLFVDADDIFIDGGTGYDRLFAEAGSLALNINLATSNLEYAAGGNWEDVFDASSVGEAVKLFGHGRNDTLTGSVFADYLDGGAADDTLIGLAGNDILDGSTGADSFFAGAGNDIMYIDADDTTINGGADYDQIFVRGYSAGVNINMTAGNLEYANGNTQDDTFNGTGATWSLKLFGQGGNDTLIGGDLADQLYGSDGIDIVSGNGGNDIVSGGAGADQLSGGAGDDIIFVDADDTLIDGGADYDRVYVTAGSAGVTINMTTANVEFAYGDAGDDVFNATGSTVAVKLQGRDGADTLTGGNLADLIYGGTGADQITGNAGNDFLSGGGADGAIDTFFFASGWGDDTVSDFQNNQDLMNFVSLGTNFAGLTITALGTNNSVVSFGGDSITLLGMQLADVDAGDFVFV